MSTHSTVTVSALIRVVDGWLCCALDRGYNNYRSVASYVVFFYVSKVFDTVLDPSLKVI